MLATAIVARFRLGFWLPTGGGGWPAGELWGLSYASSSSDAHLAKRVGQVAPFVQKKQVLDVVSVQHASLPRFWRWCFGEAFFAVETCSFSGSCMDGRDAMELSGAASYYIAHRGIHGSSVGSQPGLHFTAQPGARSIPNLGTSLAVPPSGVDSAAFQVESPLAASSHGGGRLGEGVSQVEPVKRKRGRPRKYGPEGSVALALSPISTSAPASSVIGSVSASGSGVPTQKRRRGRPPGTGRKQVLASLGEYLMIFVMNYLSTIWSMTGKLDSEIGLQQVTGSLAQQAWALLHMSLPLQLEKYVAPQSCLLKNELQFVSAFPFSQGSK
ncbi:hypothetical protein ZIOFF_028613 [Zingiber officinale]|uniref:AT-hook motif nuclear-localized protein n=1 Tax=Zingiber officinale TaxID=94328 RepID=A0A8J5GNB3_ZINOF|nr:hypothetical protein ZIOFF_028613 [Zingiber officinale]